MEVRGVSIRTILEAIERAFGADGLARVKEELDPRTRAHLEPMVLASSFYPISVSADLHRAVRRLFGAGGLGANRRVGSEAARLDFGGVYRLFIRAADYETLLRGLDRAWLRYNSRGVVLWDELGAGSARGQVRDVDGYTEEMWHSIAGRLEQILIMGGAKKAAVNVVDWSPEQVTFQARWVP